MDFKNPYFLGQTYYGFWLPLPESIQEKCSPSDPIIKLFAEAIKLKVLMSFDKDPIIVAEQTVFKSSFREGILKFPGSIGWKAELSWEKDK